MRKINIVSEPCPPGPRCYLRLAVQRAAHSRQCLLQLCSETESNCDTLLQRSATRQAGAIGACCRTQHISDRSITVTAELDRKGYSHRFLIADVRRSWNVAAMEQLSPAYISALASQLAALSAFLGGFAATFLATLLTLGHQSRLMTITIGFAVTSSVSFIVAVVAATMLTAIYHPAAPAFMAAATASQPRTIMSLGFDRVKVWRLRIETI